MAILGALVAAGIAGPAFGQAGPPLLIDSDAFSGWDIRGSNSLHLESYNVRGQNKSLSPYPNEGFQPFNDTEMSFSRRESPYEEFRGGVAGVLNYSPYRSEDEDFTLERLNLVWEKGDAETPFRAEAGDFFGFYSLRTLQRSLKGAQVDLQPHVTKGGTRHSVQFMSGFSSPTYRDVDLKEDLYSGGSWLLEDPQFGNYSISLVNNVREQNSFHRDLNQTVVSIAGQKAFEAVGQRISLEGELGVLGGDVDLGTASRYNRQDKGLFFLFDGRTIERPLSYSLRYERYGRDYQPNGAAITPNQQLTELRGGYRLEDGILVNARLEQLTSNLEATTALETTLGGLTVSGPMFQSVVPGASVRLDTTVQKVENSPGTTRTLTRSASASGSAPIDRMWTGNIGLRFQESLDRTSGGRAITRELTVSGDRRISLYGLDGSVTPGLVLRRNGGSIQSIDAGPSVALNVAGGPHTVGLNYAFLAQNPSGEGVDSHDLSATYQYTVGAHVFGAEMAYQERLPDRTFGTVSYKFGVFWRVNFARPAQVADRGQDRQAPLGTGEPSDFRLTDAPPGLLLSDATAAFGRYRIVGGIERPGLIVYETRNLPSISQRQRIAVESESGRVKRTALIVDFDDTTDVAANSRLFSRIREILISRYGNPDTTFSLGQIKSTLAADVNNGSFIRTAQWRAGSSTIRLGIPRRRDRQVRIEVQISSGFAPPRETLWSIEQAR